MLDAPYADFTDFDSWHSSGWSPVYDRMTSRPHLVGFTTLQCGGERLMIGQKTDDENGAFLIVGQATGAFNAWVVETGDYRALPGCWAL